MKQTKTKLKQRNYLIKDLFSGKYDAKVEEGKKEKMNSRKRSKKAIDEKLKEMDSDDFVVA